MEEEQEMGSWPLFCPRACGRSDTVLGKPKDTRHACDPQAIVGHPGMFFRCCYTLLLS